jgi:hypothetical protein
MLQEIAIGPEVFCAAEYDDPALGDAMALSCLGNLADAALSDCLVRNLHNGGWARFVATLRDCLHPKGKELLKKLGQQNRLISAEPCRAQEPSDLATWQDEAWQSHQRKPLHGLIFGRQAKSAVYRDQPTVTAIQTITHAPFWKNRRRSWEVGRTNQAYLSVIEPLLKHAKSLLFVDPHLDPSRPDYREFIALLEPCFVRNPPPVIEVHRLAYLESHDKRPQLAAIQAIFERHWGPELRRRHRSIRVFLWDEFHDRCLLSNLVGLLWANGFDTTTDPRKKVGIERRDQKVRDELMRKFDKNSTELRPHGFFDLPSATN